MKEGWINALRKGPVVFDGAMGTLFYERGQLYTACFEELNVSNPALVTSIHRDYLQAGAHVLKTNTFGANRIRLKQHGFDSRVAELNKAAVMLAKQVAENRAWVGASVGPTGILSKSTVDHDSDAIRDVFTEQCVALCEAGVDVICLETFRHPDEVDLAVRGAQEAIKRTGSSASILAQVSFDALGTMADGSEPEAVAKLLAELCVDAIGVNCANGPAGVFEMVTRMAGPGLPLVAQPNAGFPQRVDGRLAYMATPDYFLVYARRLFKAGIRGVGGCCGTTPDHIRKIAAAARMMGAHQSDDGGGMRDSDHAPASLEHYVESIPLAEKGVVGQKLHQKKFFVSVEVNPPVGLSLEKALAGAKLLKEGGIDVINVADGARATARMSNLALCVRIQEQLGMPALMHVTTRDRNVLGLLAHLLGAHELGVRNLVIITGDPPKMGDYPDATAVYDVDSIGLLRMVQSLNHGVDPGGKALGAPTRFLCATGAEPAAKDYAREIERLKLKCEAGAELIMTQPVYDPAVLDKFLRDIESFHVPVLVGLLPLASYRNAEFLHNEVPGMSIPEDVRERMRKAGNADLARKEGINVAKEMLSAVKNRVQGAYIMPPFGRYELALEVVRDFL